MKLQNQLGVASAHVIANGNSQYIDLLAADVVVLDVNLTGLGGTAPTLQFFFERLGADGIYYPIYTSEALNAATKLSTSIGKGMEKNIPIGQAGRLRWLFGGTGYSGTINGAANSATQTFDDTAGILAGDVLHFATANVNRTVDHVVSGTSVVFTASVNAADNEVVTGATPTAIFSYSAQYDKLYS